MKIKKFNELNENLQNSYIKGYSYEIIGLDIKPNPYNDSENFIIFKVKVYSGGDSLDLVEEVISKEFNSMGYEIDNIYEDEDTLGEFEGDSLEFHVKLQESDLIQLFKVKIT